MDVAGITGLMMRASLKGTAHRSAERIALDSESLGGAIATKAGTFVTGTAYRGAADPAGPKWWQGWTNYATN